ncbi:MAG: phosphoethanolamine--lipid A transferase [Burkholderiaceae bacterium]
MTHSRLPVVNPLTLIALSAVYLTLALNTSFWKLLIERLGADQAGSAVLPALLVAFLFFLNVFLISIFRFPYVLKAAIVIMLIASAAGSYFMNKYGVLIDDGMLRNALQTDAVEVSGLISFNMIVQLVVLGLLPALLVIYTPLRWPGAGKSLIQTVGLSALALSLALGTVLIHFKATAPFFRVHGKEMRWRAAPFNILLSTAYLLRGTKLFAKDTSFKQIASSVTLDKSDPQSAEPALLILVVGETARASSFSLNGYERNTNAPLDGLPVTSFTKVSSCGTATAISLPCMFSDLGRSDFSVTEAPYRENLLDLAKRAGYNTIWIDNQSGSKGVADRVSYRKITPAEGQTSEVNDLAFISEVESILKEPPQKTLLVLHQMGSHGPEYFKRSLESTKHFLPECTSKQLDQCTAETIRNAYDNTIVNTSQLLAGIIGSVNRSAGKRPVGMVYVSDHGESLGEHGLYLHGMPYMLAPAEQTSVPLIYWANDEFGQFNHTPRECVADKANHPLSHDNLFAMMIGFLRLKTDVYRPARDPFSNCRQRLNPSNNESASASANATLYKISDQSPGLRQ